MLRISSLAAAMVAMSSLAACYHDTPPSLAPVAVPEVDGELEVVSQESTAIETTDHQNSACLGGGIGALVGAEACLDANYTTQREVREVKSTMSLGGVPLNLAQFDALTDPTYDDSLRILDGHRQACIRSRIPEWTGIALAVGGAVALGLADGDRTTEVVGWTALGAGAATYVVGYVAFGGMRCEEGNRVFNQINYERNADVIAVSGEARARELQELADQFNLRQAQARATQARAAQTSEADHD